MYWCSVFVDVIWLFDVVLMCVIGVFYEKVMVIDDLVEWMVFLNCG